MQSPWETADAVQLRDFIKANPRFLEAIRTRIPPITKDLAVEARAMSGSERAGSEKVLEIIDDLRSDQLAPEKTPFM